MSLLRAIATVSSFTMISRVLGFARDILIAASVGAGPVADAFFVAFKLPNFFRRLFAEGAFNAGFVPLFSSLLTTEGKQAARVFAEQALSVLLLTLFVFVTAFQVAMPWLMYVLAPGFADDPQRFDLAVAFTRLTFPYLLFISLVSLLGGVLNSLRRFAAVAGTPILLNLSLIGAVTLLARYTETPGHALAWGVAIAGILQFVWLVIAAARVGMDLRLPRPRLTPKVKELMRLMLPAAIGAGVVQVNLLVDVMLASLLPPGSVSYLFYADRLNQLPIGVVGVAVGTALLPELSRRVAAGEGALARSTLNRAIEMALLLTLPAAAALIAVPDELIGTLFQRGAFGPAEAEATAQALLAFAVGLPAYVLIKVLGPAFFARHDTRTPVIFGVVAMLANIVFAVVLMQFLLHAGLALATALSAWLNAGMLAIGLWRRGHLAPDRELQRALWRMLASAGLMAAGLLALAAVLATPFQGGEASRAWALAVLVVGGLAFYGLATQATGAVDWRRLKGLLRGRPARGEP